MTQQIALVWALGAALFLASFPASDGREAPGEAAPCGRMLYMRHCVACHGQQGYGDGEIADLLSPRPRDFGAYHFRLISTDNGVPTDQDLFEVITRGMVGSAMPPHAHLSTEERWALVGFVRQLMTVQGMQRHLLEAEEMGDDLSEEVAHEISFREPGNVVPMPPEVAPTRELLAEGRLLYVRACASCHDLDGTGRSRTDMKDSLGHPLFARDFTAGIMKGGTEKLDLFRRIILGMPGTPMPAIDLSPRETWALIHYTRSMIRPGAQEHLAQERTILEATPVFESLTTSPLAQVWNDIPSRWIPLTPLSWKESRVEGVMVQAAWDGRDLALRLTWEDTTFPLESESVSGFGDAASIRFSTTEIPPFFGSGRLEATHEIWRWREALREHQILPPGLEVSAVRDHGCVKLVMKRTLAADQRFGLAPGGELSLAFELWNGAASSREEERDVSIWHRIRIPD